MAVSANWEVLFVGVLNRRAPIFFGGGGIYRAPDFSNLPYVSRCSGWEVDVEALTRLLPLGSSLGWRECGRRTSGGYGRASTI